MSNHIYEKCYKAILKINKETFQTMAVSYKNYVKKSEHIVVNHENLNKASSITRAAIKELEDGYKTKKHSNKNVIVYLERLSTLNSSLGKYGTKLIQLLSSNQNDFLQRTKKLVLRNQELMENIKKGDIPADELLIQIIQLGKDVQNITNNIIPSYKKNIELMLKKIDNIHSDEIFMLKKKILKLDRETFQKVKFKYWITIPNEFLKPNSKFLNSLETS
jgi:hypothetical protein